MQMHALVIKNAGSPFQSDFDHTTMSVDVDVRMRQILQHACICTAASLDV